jgi:hypothetical protein
MKNSITFFCTIISALLLTVFISAAKDTPQEKPWREIAKRTHSAIDERTELVIRSEAEWKKWWADHISQGDENNAAPPIDFTKEIILVAGMGTKNTGGFSIECSSIKREGNVLTATFQTRSPAPDAMVTMALTAPCIIIAVPQHAGEVKFVVK